MTAKRKKSRHVITIFSLVGAVAFALLLGGCADAYYANNGIRSPEARYNTYYAPDYYPYLSLGRLLRRRVLLRRVSSDSIQVFRVIRL